MTLPEINQDLHALEIRLHRYEQTYGVASMNFYLLYQQGLLDDEGFEQSTEFARWASAYEIWQRRKRSQESMQE